jgi:hypothetical protein
MMSKRLFSGLLFFLLLPSSKAHCPLCTAGAAVAAGGAVYLGVHLAVVSLFIGAFAVSMGWWISRLIKKQYIPYQKWVLILLSFATTVLPILPFLSQNVPLYFPNMGPYGRTFSLNLSIITSILGGLVVCTTPWMSKKISSLRKGKIFPFQGVMITLAILIVLGTILQVVL